jgi:hypothetical protein
MSRMTSTGRLRAIAAGLAGAGCVLLAAGCGNGTSGLATVGSTATATAQSSAQSAGQAGSAAQSTAQAGGTARASGQATPSGTAAAGSAAPLKLADFPATKDGDLAREICQAWAGLRGQYYSRVKSDTASQLSQWFSGPDWTTVHADSLQLTADRTYVHLGASLGVATAGNAASVETGQAVDRACSSGN